MTRQPLRPDPEKPPYLQPARLDSAGDGPSNRTLLVAIAIFSAITALGTIAGVGYWGYLNWKSNRVLDEMSSSTAGPEQDISGAWSGNYTGGGKDYPVKVHIQNSNPLSGTIEYVGTICTATWKESGRSYGAILVDEKIDPSTQNKCSNTSWKLEIDGSMIEGSLEWTASDNQDGTLALHKG